LYTKGRKTRLEKKTEKVPCYVRRRFQEKKRFCRGRKGKQGKRARKGLNQYVNIKGKG